MVASDLNVGSGGLSFMTHSFCWKKEALEIKDLTIALAYKGHEFTE